MYKGEVVWKINEERFKNVVLKLVRVHVVFENSEPHIEEPASISFAPLSSLTNDQRLHFETLGERIELFPEIGSRGFIRPMEQNDGWLIVQAGVYRYRVFHINGGLLVK